MERIYVVCFTGSSGLTDYSVSLCRELQSKADVTFITASSYDPQKYRVEFPFVRIFRRTRHYPLDMFRFISFVLKNKPDVVLFQSWLKYPALEVWVLQLFKRCGIRVALSIHDLLPHYPGPLSKFNLSMYYRCFDSLIVHSSRAERELVLMGVKSKPLMVPHGVYDIFKLDNLSREDVASQLGVINKSDFVVLFFGNIETRKGIIEFLEAALLLAAHPNIVFVVAGRNDLKLSSKERQQFETFRVKKNVIVHDHPIPFEVVQQYFTVADVVALPYLEGTTSGVLKLAMAFDKPVIATDVGDFTETLRDWSGITLKNGKIAVELSAAIQEMQSQYSDYLARIGTVKEKYSWQSIGRQYIGHLLEHDSIEPSRATPAFKK